MRKPSYTMMLVATMTVTILAAFYWFDQWRGSAVGSVELTADVAVKASDQSAGTNAPSAPAGGSRIVQSPSPNPASPAVASDEGPDYAAMHDALAEQLAESLPTLRSQYAEANKYPPGSQPIRSAAELAQYQPHQSTDVSAPFPGEVPGDEVALSLQLDRYQYFEGDRIAAAAVLNASAANSLMAAEVTFLLKDADGNTLLTQPAQPDAAAGDGMASSGRGLMASAVLLPPAATASGELFVEALARFSTSAGTGERSASLIAPLRYDTAVARLTAVLPSHVEGPELVVPLQFTVRQPGYYFVEANLYSRQTNTPLLHLQSEGRLELPGGMQSLRAHIAALKASGDEGPYLLKDFRIERAAEDGESADLPGSAPKQQYAVEGFSFSSYTDLPYEDPLAEERAEFLEKLGTL
ncbi:MAG: hypothetical protein CME36_04755 [unclassified Hahellaceae]|nr:hypothetical protein [Hahellaceae bacterium]|tara:strand:+ start:16726 stop:17955 length:1230 start_codon:yes stop_codon:yes gene_type:complete